MASEDELIKARFKGPDRRKFDKIKQHHCLNESDTLRYCVRFTHDALLNSGQVPPDYPMNKDLAFKILGHLYPGRDFEEFKEGLGKPRGFSNVDIPDS